MSALKFKDNEKQAIQNKFDDISNGIKLVKNCGGDSLESWLQEAREVFGSNGLEVLNSNVHEKAEHIQRGWDDLYVSASKLWQYKSEVLGYRYLLSKPIVGAPKREKKFKLKEHLKFLYDTGVISEMGVYAIFYDLVQRQNLPYVSGKEGQKVVIEQFKRNWNMKNSGGYNVRRRMKGELLKIENPVLLTLTLDHKKVEETLPGDTNMDWVMWSIWNIGSWVRQFNKRLYQYQQRRGIAWDFIGWVIEFMGEKEDTEERKYLNRGAPHPHIIYNGKWIGKINEIQDLWGLGKVEITTKRDIQKRFPDRSIDSLYVANYLTKYVNKAKGKAVKEGKVHKGYAWLVFSGGRVFSLKHNKKEVNIASL